MRHCPHCTFPLEAIVYHGTQLDHCRRCGGTFLDPGEAAQQFGPAAEPETWKRAPITKALGATALECPKDGARLEAFEVAFDGQAVTVELCPSCAGMWLDAREGLALREIVLLAGQEKDTGLADRASRHGVAGYLFQLFSGLPVEVWNPKRRTPWATLGLTGGLLTIFLISTTMSERDLVQWWAVPERIFNDGAWWTLVTSSFFHAGWLHLLGNLYFLYTFGDNIEDTLGAPRFLLLYAAAAVAGSLLQALTQLDPGVASLGASGAIAGLMGAYFLLFQRVRLYLVFFFVRVRVPAFWYLGFWIAINVLRAVTDAGNATGVAWMDHVGGFATGAALGWWFRPRALVERLRRA